MPLPIYDASAADTSLATIGAIVGIAAGKGGVGKSTLTVALADVFHRRGMRVGVLDTDLYGPSIRQMLPEDIPPKQEGDILIPAVSRGIQVMSMAYFRKEQDPFVVRAPIANRWITHFLTHVQWGKLDLLLIDFPPGTGDIQLTIAQKASLSGAVMVTTPQHVALLDVRKAMGLFDAVQVPVLGIVENMSFFLPAPGSAKMYPFGRGGGEQLASEKGVPLLGQIPLEPALAACCDAGQSLFGSHAPSSDSTQRAFEAVATETLLQLQVARHKNQRQLGEFDVPW